jgi:xanthosine utilization system XapX-like protein
MARTRSEPPDLTQRVLQLAGAVTGGAFFFYLVGGVATWRRFHTLGLADEASVAALPRSNLLVSGLLTMRHPIALALIALALYQLLTWTPPARHGMNSEAPASLWSRGIRELSSKQRRVQVALVAVFAAVAVEGVLQVWDDVLLISVAAGLAIGASEIAVRGPVRRRAPIGFALVLCLGIVSAGVQYFHLARPPTHLERVALFFDHEQRDPQVVGYLIADASGFVYVAPRLGPCRARHEVDAYRREEIARMRLGRRIKVWPADRPPRGQDLSQCLIEEAEDLREQRRP